MSTTVLRERVPLLEARPELTRHLTPEDRGELASVTLPVLMAGPGQIPLTDLLDRHNAFGAAVLDGLVMGSLCVGKQTGIHLLGPGDLLTPESEVWPAWLGDLEFRASTPVRLGLFSGDLLIAARRWPRLVEGLYASYGEQLHRLSAQLVICQLPRVEDRVLAVLWLLAESWGHVTPAGVRLPLTLTHETLGGLVGARRPTVTLALRKLTDEGALVAQEGAWLLLESPGLPDETSATVAPAPPPAQILRPWSAAPEPEPEPNPDPDPSIAYAELRDTVQRLREQHRMDRQQLQERLERVRSTRARVIASRRRISKRPVRPPLPPSS